MTKADKRDIELSFQEFNTSKTIVDKLTDMGIDVESGIAKTGVSGLISGSKPGKTFFRFFSTNV